MSDTKLNVKDFNEEEIIEGLELLMKKRLREKRIASGEIKGHQKWSDKTDEQKAKHYAYNKKRNMKIKLVLQKAKEMGIEV